MVKNSKSFNIFYTLWLKEHDESQGSDKRTYEYLHRQIHNHACRDRATDIANEFRDQSRSRVVAAAEGQSEVDKLPPGTCRNIMKFCKCTVDGCTFGRDKK